MVVLIAVLGVLAAFRGGRGSKAPESAQVASIAVLPFVDMSPEKNQEYFSDGLAEELLNECLSITEFRRCDRSFRAQRPLENDQQATLRLRG
jgi:TolB-like protein